MIGGDIHGSANIDILTLELDIITPGMDERGVLDAISLNKSGAAAVAARAGGLILGRRENSGVIAHAPAEIKGVASGFVFAKIIQSIIHAHANARRDDEGIQ